MRNIIIIALFGVLGLYGNINAQKNSKDIVFGNRTFVVQEASEIELFEVEKYRTKADSQDGKKQYTADYEILKKIELSKKDKKHLQDEFLEAKNYETTVFKSCPFIGNYGVVFTKGDDKIIVIVGNKNCGKVLIFDSILDSKDEKNIKNYDLSQKNDIETKISKVVK
jgi:hypothetical protein